MFLARIAARQGGQLLLSCKALASSTACRFIPVHFLTPLTVFPHPIRLGAEYFCAGTWLYL
jgi:hypothetical protein